MNPNWNAVWTAVREFSSIDPDDIVLIGGVAVYLHTKVADRPDLPAEYTHDADFYVSRAVWSLIRSEHESVFNRRLSKHQVTINQVELDLYLEHQHALRVSYADLRQASVDISGIQVAGLEHLLLLKLDAYADRAASAHGRKDSRDIVKLLVLLSDTEPDYALAQATDEDVAALRSLIRSNVFSDLTKGNAHQASRLRRESRVFFDKLQRALR
mgnify:CR=1 FL=1